MRTRAMGKAIVRTVSEDDMAGGGIGHVADRVVADKPPESGADGRLIGLAKNGIDNIEQIDVTILSKVGVEREAQQAAVFSVPNLIPQINERQGKNRSVLNHPDTA